MVPVNYKGKEYTADRPVLLSRAEVKPIKPLSGVNLGASFDKFKKSF